MSFWVYILRCADGSFYTGHTDDLEQRLAQHQCGEIPDSHTHSRRPVTLIFSQEFSSRDAALESEIHIKKWSRAKKQALIAGDWQQVSALAKRRTKRGSIAPVSIDRCAVASTVAPGHERESVVSNDRCAVTSTLAPDHERAVRNANRPPKNSVRGEEGSRRLRQQATESPSRTTPLNTDERWMRHALAPDHERAVRNANRPPENSVRGEEGSRRLRQQATESPSRTTPLDTDERWMRHALAPDHERAVRNANRPPENPVRGEEGSRRLRQQATESPSRTTPLDTDERWMRHALAPDHERAVRNANRPPKNSVRGEEGSRRLRQQATESPSRTTPLNTDERWMRHALALADRAEHENDEIPVGAVIVDADGHVVGEGWNRNITDHDPSAHAEIVALRAAGKALGNHRLLGCTLYVTLEPCAMCAMAMVHARIVRMVFAASDPKTGAAGSVFDLLADPRHNHRVSAHGGVLAEDASARLRTYFRRKRVKNLDPEIVNRESGSPASED